jgi:hypothetical protein
VDLVARKHAIENCTAYNLFSLTRIPSIDSMLISALLYVLISKVSRHGEEDHGVSEKTTLPWWTGLRGEPSDHVDRLVVNTVRFRSVAVDVRRVWLRSPAGPW